MERDKLIEKLKSAKERLNKYIKPEDHLWAVGLNPDELDLILTSLTAPVPDGKVTDEEIELAGLECERRLQDFATTFNYTFKEGAKWMQDKLTKTPDAG